MKKDKKTKSEIDFANKNPGWEKIEKYSIWISDQDDRPRVICSFHVEPEHLEMFKQVIERIKYSKDLKNKKKRILHGVSGPKLYGATNNHRECYDVSIVATSGEFYTIGIYHELIKMSFNKSKSCRNYANFRLKKFSNEI